MEKIKTMRDCEKILLDMGIDKIHGTRKDKKDSNLGFELERRTESLWVFQVKIGPPLNWRRIMMSIEQAKDWLWDLRKYYNHELEEKQKTIEKLMGTKSLEVTKWTK